MARKNVFSENTRQIILLAVMVFLFRILYVDVYRRLQDEFGYVIYDYIFVFLRDFLSVSVALLLDVAFIMVLNRRLSYGKKPFRRISIMIGYIIFISAILAFLVNRAFISRPDVAAENFFSGHLLLSFLAVLLVNAVIVAVADLLFYFRKSRVELVMEANKKRKAQYQYQQLKRQLNPHFLFNSLNILDYLVQEGDTKRASDYIKKLAGVYRYLLKEGEHKLVPLRNELDFVRKYTGLLKERFTDGLEVEIDIPAGDMDVMVVPCGIQLLVENATKHNIVSGAAPLRISVRTRDGMIEVSNNLQPRIIEYESNGVGLSNIRRQCLDILGVEPVIEKTEEHFTVYLPFSREIPGAGTGQETDIFADD